MNRKGTTPAMCVASEIEDFANWALSQYIYII